MQASRRNFLMGAAALSAAVVTPETVRAMAAMQASADWALATADLEADVAPRVLRLVHGRAPAGLTGTLFRNGPGKFRRPGGSATHWFDGDGLMRAFRINDGQVTLDARFADTPKRRWESEIGAVVSPGFGTAGDARARVGSNDDVNAANTAVMLAGDEVWALWEGGSPLAMSAADLSTRRFVSLRDDLKGMPFQAHPRYDPDGTIWNIGLNGDKAIVWRLNADRSLNTAQLIDLPRASFMHDFTATARHLILVLQPWVFDHRGMPYASQFAWKPELGTQILVVDKADLSRRRLFDLPAFSYFHLGDAWEDRSGTIRFDVAAGKDVAFAIDGARVLVEQRGSVPGEHAVLKLVTLHADGRAELASSGVTAEFPKNDPRRAGLPRRLTVHVAGERPDRPLPTGLATWNWDSGVSDYFNFGVTQIVEEAVFVPRGPDETDAWLIAPSINLREGVTELHAFDAACVADGPVATWRADVALPAGFHGVWAG
ncbi:MULTISPECIES: carotenoid oxygenase family protein [unclassified Brevundimonas]|uniref:carotenoid oxygenase family protein n=1 Tax=unclassified Brevundimonas TaxID=2622653 RepID=UPI0006F30CD0|nr:MULTISPECIES: carotenoid oxygenase family protein [unclassified Brevundimonas]KQY88079.1 carotenoid oxygenase [Brevundimonas sp. Root1423]KRA28623.1 carotenoid oxygenase [Brevundimonas sp. Root608]